MELNVAASGLRSHRRATLKWSHSGLMPMLQIRVLNPAQIPRAGALDGLPSWIAVDGRPFCPIGNVVGLRVTYHHQPAKRGRCQVSRASSSAQSRRIRCGKSVRRRLTRRWRRNAQISATLRAWPRPLAQSIRRLKAAELFRPLEYRLLPVGRVLLVGGDHLHIWGPGRRNSQLTCDDPAQQGLRSATASGSGGVDCGVVVPACLTVLASDARKSC